MPRPSRPRKPHLPQNCIPFSFLSHSTGTIIQEPVEKATIVLQKYNIGEGTAMSCHTVFLEHHSNTEYRLE